ncbi:glycosyltransferase [Microbacterium phage Dewdrop]|nr:glycosyltransferase [Microbacterium phage Leaf]QGZ17520.1 glycosyltransferase [Microbacterium phage Dewdrop]
MSEPKLPLLPVKATGNGIPPVLHRIWVGGEPPAWVIDSWVRWNEFLEESVHEWEVISWTDFSIQDTPLERIADIADHYGLPPRGKADLLRVVAVSLYGGFYMDADVVPLRSLDDLIDNPAIPLWTTSHPESREQRVLWNGGFGAQPGSQYLADILEHANRGIQRRVVNEHFLAGPRAYRQYLPEDAITEWDFQFEATAAERRTMAQGGRFNLEELRRKYPARLKHIGPRES